MRFGVIGLGPHGRRIVDALRTLPGATLTAVVDRREDALTWPGIDSNVRRATDLRDVLGECEVVCIATNGPSHAELAISAMESGVRRVMVEKPMACSPAECDRMSDVARRSSARLLVNQSRRVDPFYCWAASELASGKAGDVRSVWIQRPGIGLGLLGTHYFDLASMLVGRSPLSVSAWIDPFLGPNPRGAEFVDPGGLVVLDYGDRRRAVIHQIEDGAGPMSVEIDTTETRWRVEERDGVVEILARDRRVRPGPGRAAAYSAYAIPEGLSARTDVATMTRAVLEDLVSDGESQCGFAHGALSVEILAAAHLSHARGNVPVSLPLRGDDRLTWLPVT